MSLQRIQRSIEGCASDALSLRDGLLSDGYAKYAEEALWLRDQLEQIVRELVDYQSAVLTDEGWTPDTFEGSDSDSEDDTPFDLDVYLDYYNSSAYTSRAEFSKTTGIAPSVLVRLERGETKKPHKFTVKKLAKALNVHPSALDSRFDPPRGA